MRIPNNNPHTSSTTSAKTVNPSHQLIGGVDAVRQIALPLFNASPRPSFRSSPAPSLATRVKRALPPGAKRISKFEQRSSISSMKPKSL